MADTITYAQLADVVYQDVRSILNRTPIPRGWSQTSYISTNDGGLLGRIPNSGFSAGVYQSGQEIVIAFAGTNPDALDPDGILDWGNNIAAGSGLLAAQIVDAAELYLRVKASHANDGTTISFTGHSLGGGLASLMAVYFNRPATVFAQAPFQAAVKLYTISSAPGGAINPGAPMVLRDRLAEKFLSDPQLNAFVDNPIGFGDSALFSARERLVSNFAINGEILRLGRSLLSAIQSDPESTINVGDTNLSFLDRHSMVLHLAALKSVDFVAASKALPNLLPQMLDLNFYGRKLRQDDPDFLERLIRDQFGVPGDSKNLLNRFSQEMLGLSKAIGHNNPLLLDTLVSTGIEYYRFFDAGENSRLFTNLDGGIQFNQGDISQPNDQQLSAPKLREYLIAHVQADALFQAEEFIGGNRRWTIALGNKGLTGAATGNISDLVFGGNGSDKFDAGAGDDFLIGGNGRDDLWGGPGNDSIFGGPGNDELFGGDGDDTITVGKGDDRIEGGAGFDSYIYNAGDGRDTIADSDGRGQILFKGTVLSGGSKSAGTGYESNDGQFHYSFVGNLSSGGTLLINGQLVVTNFHNGDLGISLGPHSPDEGNPTDQYHYLGGVDADGVLRGVYPTTYEPSGNWQVDQQFIDGSDLDDHYIAALVDDSGEGAPPVAGGAGGLMDGKAGNDLFEGAVYFFDESYGGPGNDVLFGAAVGASLDPPADPVDGDILGGNAGQDEITGGIFDDFLYGDESIFFADNFEEGHYRYVFSNGMIIDSNESTGEVRVELLGENAAGPWPRAFETARDAFDYVLGITEETDLDTLYDDVVDGIDGNDEIVGGNGSDTLIGGDGNDLITGDYDASFYLGPDARQVGFGEYSYLLGKPGDDYLDGGDGDDILSDEFGGSDQLFGGDGDDILINNDGEPLPQFYSEGEIPEAVAYINLLDGGIGNDQIHSTSAHPGSYDLIFGGEGDDVVDFIGYSAQIDLGEGNNILHADASLTGSFLAVFGGDGDDQLTIEYADDIDVSGGAGDDTISAAGRRIRVDQTGAHPGDFDSLNLSFASTLVAVERDRGDLVLTNLSGEESIVTLMNWFEEGAHPLDQIAFADGMTWSPAHVAVELSKNHTAGTSGNDVLFSNGRDYQLRGLDGDDVLIGRDSGMLLDGGMGNDDIRLPDSNQGFVVGGRGDDVLTGSGVFAYNRGDGRDTLVNFSGTISLGGISYENVSMTTDNGGLNLDFGLGDSISLIDPRYLFVNPGAGLGPEPLLLQIVSPTLIATYDLAHGGEPIQTSLDSAIGGNLAYQYAMTGSTNSSSDAISSTALDEMNLGSSLQGLRLGRSLNEILFEMGEGSRAVAALDGVDTIRFGPGIGPDNLKLGLGSLAIRVGDFGDVLHLGSFDPADVHGPRDFGNFRFDDGSLLTYEQLVSKGFDIDGTDGDDVITATNTTDRIDGKGGNDLLSGGYGTDTYFFGAGYGHDEIVEAPSIYDQDVVRIRTRSDAVTVERDNNDIVIRIADVDDSLALKSWYTDSSARVESVQFDDGAIWDGANLESRAKDPGATELMLTTKDLKDSTTSDLFVIKVAEDNSVSLASVVDAVVTATDEGALTATDEEEGVAIASGEEKSVDLPLVAGGADSSRGGHDVAQIDTPLDGLDLGFRPALGSGPANEISTSPQAGNFTSRSAVAEAVQSLQDWYADGDSIGDIQLSFESPTVARDLAEISENPSIQTGQTGRPNQGIDAEDTPGLSSWSIGYSLMEMHLAKSDDAALGMEVGHFNGLNGALGVGLDVAQAMIGSARFGSDAQSMQMLSGLTEGLAVLS